MTPCADACQLNLHNIQWVNLEKYLFLTLQNRFNNEEYVFLRLVETSESPKNVSRALGCHPP